MNDIIPLVQRHGLRLGSDKEQIMDANEIQKVTGIKVNNAMTVPRAKLNEITREIKELGHMGHLAPMYQLNSMWGKIDFVKSVDPVKGEKLAGLAQRVVRDIVGKHVPKPKDLTRNCRSIRSSHA